MGDITKEELMAMMDVQARSATAMENIANSIRQVSEQNKEATKIQAESVKETVLRQQEIVKEAILERDKTVTTTIGAFNKGVADIQKEVGANHDIVTKIKDDTGWLKIIIGSSTLIILIASVVIQFVMGSIQTRKQLADLEVKILHHITETK